MKPILLVDFGSTNTKVTAVDVEDCRILGTAAVYTTVETDINEGLDHGLEILEKETGPLDFEERYACSSAAGGLKMISIGLVPDLTAQASREASLGAGAKVWKTYSFQLTKGDFKEIEEYHPDIILLTGGTDGGNTENILYNAQVLSALSYDCPIVIAGNRNAADQCQEILKGRSTFVCENVMPRLGELNVIPAQKQIREIFLKRIVQGKGLSKAADLVSGIIMPTPSAMMEAMELLAEAGASYISPHAETINSDAFRILNLIEKCGCKKGIVLNPATPLSYAEAYLNRIDILTLMTVDVGFAGQPFIEEVLDKIALAKKWREERGYHYEIQIDGSCNTRTYKKLTEAGADILIVGSSGLFTLDQDINRAIDKMYENYEVCIKA